MEGKVSAAVTACRTAAPGGLQEKFACPPADSRWGNEAKTAHLKSRGGGKEKQI